MPSLVTRSSLESAWEFVYQSRKHGLWPKNEAPPHDKTYRLHHSWLRREHVEFSVIQPGAGFYHLETQSFFGSGEFSSLSAVERTPRCRLESAPEGSYAPTHRLIENPGRLRSKPEIVEQADEMSPAKTQTTEEIAFEAAELQCSALPALPASRGP